MLIRPLSSVRLQFHILPRLRRSAEGVLRRALCGVFANPRDDARLPNIIDCLERASAANSAPAEPPAPRSQFPDLLAHRVVRQYFSKPDIRAQAATVKIGPALHRLIQNPYVCICAPSCRSLDNSIGAKLAKRRRSHFMIEGQVLGDLGDSIQTAWPS